MKSLRPALALLLFGLPAAGQGFQAGKLPAATRDSFEVVYQTQAIGAFVLSLTRTGDAFSFVGAANLPQIGVSEIDSLVFSAATLAPISMSNRVSMQGQNAVSRVTITAGKATGTAQTPGPAGIQSVPVDVVVGTGVIGDGAEIALLPTLDLAEEFTTSFVTFDGKTGKTKKYDLKVLGKESIKIPLGTFETYKVQLTSDETVSIFLTTAEPRQIMLIRLEGQNLEMRRAK